MQELLQEMHSWMLAYVQSFYNSNEKIQQAMLLKEEHTKKVTAICRDLAMHLGLSTDDCLLAELMGLFHDVGRFEQFTRYQTFNDSISENHALLGLKVIKDLPLAERLSMDDYEAFCFAIANHNAKEIAKTENPRQLFFAQLLRDADKLDIYRVLEPFLQPSDGSGCSEDFLQRFINGEQCDYSQIKTQDDRKLVRLMWVYDVNFSWTLQKIVEADYIRRILACLPQTDLLAEGSKKLSSYVADRLAKKDVVSW